MPIIIHFLNYIHPVSTKAELSVQQFFIFIRNDIILAEHVYSVDQKIYFTLTSEETAVIEQYKDIIRRQVDGRGHETYLRDIETFGVEQFDNTIKITLADKEGRTFEKTFNLYK